MIEQPVVWTPLADTYLPADRTTEFLTAAARTRWVPADGKHPMSPGLALKQTIVALGIPGVREVGYSETWEANDTTYAAPAGEHPDLIGTYTILAARTEQMQMFFLDLGVGVAPIIAMDTP